MKTFNLIGSLLVLLALGLSVPASASESDHHEDEHGGEHYEEGEHHEENDRVQISAEAARRAGIETALAGPSIIRETITVYGKTALDHDNISHVRARYPGPVVEVMAEIGQRLEKGQRLATIESNDSLQTYPLLAPIAGQVIEKQISRDEYSGDRVLFTIVNDDRLWAELQVFPGQRPRVARGQKVRILANDRELESIIASLAPATHGKPFVIARAVVDNPGGHWTPDLMVRGQVVVGEVELPLVVDNRALQPFRGATVVFVKTGDGYQARPLQLGRSDGRMTEVLGGLEAGDRYVTANSYLIKADIEKSGAAHHH